MVQAVRVFVVLVLTAAGCLPEGARGQGSRPFLLETAASERLLEEGRTHLLHLRLPQAESAFRRLAECADGAVAAYHYLSLAALMQFAVTDDDAHYDTYLALADTLERALVGAPAGPWRRYLEGDLALRRSFAYAKAGHYVRAALAGRSAYGHYERVLKEAPAFYEPYRGMGVLHLVIGTLPRGYRRLLRFLGYPGEVETGLHELRVAVERSRFEREEAEVVLILTDALLYDEQERALAGMQALYARYPQSPLFAYLHGFMLLKNRRAAEAERVLAPIARRPVGPKDLYINYVDYLLGDALFRQNRFAEAEHFLRRYLARHEGPALKAAAHLALGYALELQGRRAEALPFYRKVEARPDFDTDEAALRAARRRLAAPFTERERQLMAGRNAYDAGRYGEAETILRRLLDDPEALPDERAEAGYRLGRVHQAQERFDEALQAYRTAAAAARDPEARWAPWSHFYIGQIHAERGEHTLAAQAFRTALSFPGRYDFYQSLEQSAKAALRRLP